jgi:hypothetical protein
MYKICRNCIKSTRGKKLVNYQKCKICKYKYLEI